MTEHQGLRASFDELWPLLVRNRRMAQVVAYIADHELNSVEAGNQIIADPQADMLLGMTIEAEEAAKALEEAWLAAHNAAVHAEFTEARKSATGSASSWASQAETPMEPVVRRSFAGIGRS